MASRAERSLPPAEALRPPLLPLPPLPPLPQPSCPTPPSPAVVRIGTHSSLIPTLPIVAATLFAAASLFIFLALYILHRRRRHRREGQTAAAPDADPEPAAEDDGGEVDHHVWYIRTAGLDESTIGAIATWVYKADEGVLGASRSNCAVCLSDFRDGELLRLLPKCDHAFHMGCVDTWLRSHVNCPLCRAPVLALVSATSDGVHGASTSFSSGLSALGSITDQEESSSVPSGLVDHNQLDGSASVTGQGTLDVESVLERSELGAVPEGRNMINRLFPDSEIEMPSDVRGQGFQPIRRSFSMSSFPRAPPPNRLKLEESTKDANLGAGLVIRTWKKQDNSSNGTTSLQKAGGFLSSTSDRFFSSKHGRHGRARSLLPHCDSPII